MMSLLDGARRARWRTGILGLLLAIVFSQVLQAQQRFTTISTRVREPDEALAMLASGEAEDANAALDVIIAAFKPERREPLEDGSGVRIFGNRAHYTDAQRQMLLDGVERVARDNLDVTRGATAFSILALIGKDRSIPESREIPRRLFRIYRQGNGRAKPPAVRLLGRLLRLSPAEAPAIIELLVSVVTTPPRKVDGLGHPSYGASQVPAEVGLDAVRRACEAGVPVLRRLYAERDRIQDGMVRRSVEQLAARGFPLADYDDTPNFSCIRDATQRHPVEKPR